MAKTAAAWHISQYAELFRAEGANGTELEFVRYSKRHLVGWTAEAEQYCRKIAAIEQMLAFDEAAIAQHIFAKLLDLSQMHHQGDKYLRGYILDERRRPAGTARIGQMIGCPTATAAKYLRILERVGLIDRCAVPTPPVGDGGDGGVDRCDSPLKTPPSTPAGGSRKGVKKGTGGSKTRKKSQSGTQVEPPPLALLKGQGKEEVKEEAEGLGLAASAKSKSKEKIGKEQCRMPKAEGQAKQQGQTESEPTGQAQTPLSPTTTPPIADMPTLPSETDAVGQVEYPPGVDTADQRLVWLEGLRRKLMHPQSPDRFAEAVYEAIREPLARDSPEGAREFGVFREYWQLAMRRKLSLPVLDRLWETNLKAARRIGKNRAKIIAAGMKRNGKPGRPGGVWRYEAGQRLLNPMGKDIKST